MQKDHITAIVKLITHSGILMRDILHLKKEDFDLDQNTILINNHKTDRIRKATIRPDDVEWFNQWMHKISDKLFPFSTRTIYHNFATNGITKPYALRKELWDQLHLLRTPDDLIATKLGYFVDVENSNEKTILFMKLQEFEEKHFGDKLWR